MDMRFELLKKAECRRIEAFDLWCWRRLLRVPWTARRSNQSIIKEISPEYSLEGLKHDSLMGTVTFSDGLELDKGDGCTTMQTYFIPWNRTLLGG